MAKHKLDRLFSEGLESFEATPTNTAWDQIEGQLNQKKNKSYWAWASIAASAALLLASSWVLLRSGEDIETIPYDYAASTIENPTLPAEIVYVPIYIHTVIEKPAKVIIRTVDTEPAKTPAIEEPVILASTEEIIVEQPEIIALEEVPLLTDEVTMASIEMPVEEEPVQLQPVTIIYKQGEPAKESNFTKAINYMEDVRMGEKRLVNFDKLRESFRSKFRSDAETD